MAGLIEHENVIANGAAPLKSNHVAPLRKARPDEELAGKSSQVLLLV
jgi:hypothetical protein